MLRGGEVEEIVALRREGLSVTEIAERTGHDRKTIRKRLADHKTPRYGPRQPRPSKLDAHKDYIDGRLRQGVWNTAVILVELRERGYTGGATTLRDYVAPKRKAVREVCVRRFETPPGHQAQVDWGYLGTIEDGESKEPIWAFDLTLGHCRACFVDIATDQRLGILLRMHEQAFSELGGVPEEILYDRMKTVVLGVDDRGEVKWHPIFLDFTGYWGFTPRLCHAYRPQTKGKVESGIRYIKRNFLPGREAASFDDLRSQLRAWVWGTANRRVHGTTHRMVLEALEEERSHLHPLCGKPPYPYVPEEKRRVGRDGYVAYGSNRYPVPWSLAGQDVLIDEFHDQLVFRQGKEMVARHKICVGRHQVISDESGYHKEMPFAHSERPGAAKIDIVAGAPVVDERPLSIYESACAGGWPK